MDWAFHKKASYMKKTICQKHPAPPTGLSIQKIIKPVAPGIPSQPVEYSISDVKLGKKHEASTSTPNTDVNQSPYYVGKSDDKTIGFLLDSAKSGHNRGNQRPRICEVSSILRDHSESSFVPHLVSIGPIHRENKKLKELEWLKECYLDDLLYRCHDPTPKKTLEACLQKVKEKIPQIRESYAGVKKNYSDDMFAGVMVMDGCFILEFCFKHIEQNLHLPNEMQNGRIAMDLMMLENQVPFSVLQALFDCSMGEASFTLSDVLDEYFAPYIQLFRSLLPEKTPVSNADHILGYLHKRCQLVAAKSSNPIPAEAAKPVDEVGIENTASNHKHAEESKLVDEKGIRNTYTAFHSIVELDTPGMNFKPHKEDDWSMTIKFQPSLFPSLPWSKPTLLMPALVINYSTELLLRNFIAYEQLFPQDCSCFTSYAVAMDMLIDTQEDIAKLVEAKVLVNRLGSNQEAADMINNICKTIFVTDFYYTEEFKQMDKYYNGYWAKKNAWRRRNIAWLRRVYFNNPWNSIALVAAIILFSLTVVQTIFTIMAA